MMVAAVGLGVIGLAGGAASARATSPTAASQGHRPVTVEEQELVTGPFTVEQIDRQNHLI
jgi:hypothetical protein